MTILKWRTNPELRDAANVEKVDVDLLVGQEEGKLEFAGRLRLRVGEWQIIGAALLLGADESRGHLRIPSNGSPHPLGTVVRNPYTPEAEDPVMQAAQCKRCGRTWEVPTLAGKPLEPAQLTCPCPIGMFRVTAAQLEKLGKLVDRFFIDTSLHSELKALYVEISGEDPWAGSE